MSKEALKEELKHIIKFLSNDGVEKSIQSNVISQYKDSWEKKIRYQKDIAKCILENFDNYDESRINLFVNGFNNCIALGQINKPDQHEKDYHAFFYGLTRFSQETKRNLMIINKKVPVKKINFLDCFFSNPPALEEFESLEEYCIQ